MRNMSFALTTMQIGFGTKTVTRRLGWQKLKAGDYIRPVKKCMGLKPGEKVQPLRGPLRVISVRRERLDRLTEDLEYGQHECRLEGFAMPPAEFVKFFCDTHRPCKPEWLVTRIEFEYQTRPPQI